jgi:hypothetical protein
MTKVTAEQAIWAQLIQESNHAVDDITSLTAEELQDLIDDLCDKHDCEFYDAMSDWRTGGVSADGLPVFSSRHYETDQVAGETPFGWVSWTYWYGGGKHGNPEEIEWIEDAYFVDVVEEEVTITKRTFSKKGD